MAHHVPGLVPEDEFQMPYRLSAFLLLLTLGVAASARPTFASTLPDRSGATAATSAARVKDGVRQLGTGPDARISVRRHDGEKVKGYVAAADEASFTIISEAGAATQVRYTDVTQVKAHNLTTGWKIAIGAGIAVGVFFVVLYVVLATNTR
jgi:hypothetical protein